MCAVAKAGKECEEFYYFVLFLKQSLGTEQFESDHRAKQRAKRSRKTVFNVIENDLSVSAPSLLSFWDTTLTNQQRRASARPALSQAHCQTRACWMADVSASGQQFPRYGFIFATFVLFCSITPILLKYTQLSCFSWLTPAGPVHLASRAGQICTHSHAAQYLRSGFSAKFKQIRAACDQNRDSKKGRVRPNSTLITNFKSGTHAIIMWWYFWVSSHLQDLQLSLAYCWKVQHVCASLMFAQILTGTKQNNL